jgi:hypothetical protein
VETYFKGFFAAATGALFVFLVVGKDFLFVPTVLSAQGYDRVEFLVFLLIGVLGKSRCRGCHVCRLFCFCALGLHLGGTCLAGVRGPCHKLLTP